MQELFEFILQNKYKKSQNKPIVSCLSKCTTDKTLNSHLIVSSNGTSGNPLTNRGTRLPKAVHIPHKKRKDNWPLFAEKGENVKYVCSKKHLMDRL